MGQISLAHGGGGEEMGELISGLIFKIFDNKILKSANDSAILSENFGGNLAFTTDSFVVSPIFFNGGDIGKIAICGTVNDLAMVGAEAKFLSCALIIEEGFEIENLEKILLSMKQSAQNVGALIVCGDTKVVPKGSCDKIFINTSGIGKIALKGIETKNLVVGDKILLSGDIGRHGAVILANREEISIQSDLKSDCKALNSVVSEILKAKIAPKAMRDATRGGISAALNEWANFTKKTIKIFEEKIAVSSEVIGICELLGFESYELANEGTFLIAVSPDDEAKTLEILRKFDKNANAIGEIIADGGRVILQNIYGASRFLEAPKGELLPRIC